MTEVLVRAPAKVNLFLHVLAREITGYHRIETLFQGLALHDRIRVRLREEPGVALRVTSEVDLGPSEDNLAVRAARAYRERAGLEGEAGLELHLEKTIPVGAGLGGGSSDAAAVLRALDWIHEGAVGERVLRELAAGLGADVPFFLGRRPRALAWGRGERLLELPPLPERPVVVAVPPFAVSTAAAYEALDRRRGRGAVAGPRSLELEDVASWERVALRAENDFQDGLFADRPLARELRDVLAGAGAAPALLSGSGSALFGVYGSDEGADDAASRIRESFEDVAVHRTRTLTSFEDLFPDDGAP